MLLDVPEVTISEINHFIRKCKSVIEKAENKYSCKFDDDFIYETVKYAIIKSRLNQKSDDYIPLLLADEIKFALAGNIINDYGKRNFLSKKGA